jgi:hypothetical protein
MLRLHSGVTRNRLSRRNTSPRCFARLHPVAASTTAAYSKRAWPQVGTPEIGYDRVTSA